MQKTTGSTSTTRNREFTTDTDIVNIILEDHKPLKEMIEVMKDSEKSEEERVAAFEEFAPALIAHAKPEEESLYVFMKNNEELREQGCEGEVEHVLADQLLEEIKRTNDADMKLAKIKVLAELVEHHIEEEEEELLPDFKKESESEERVKLGNEFLELKVKYLAAGDDNIIPDPKMEKFEKAIRH
ncbi:MAG: hemerythrin domain-containing protein [Bdellovibrionota bacterium]